MSQMTYKGITTEIKAIPSTAGGRRQCDDVFKGLGIASTLLKTLYVQLALKARAT